MTRLIFVTVGVFIIGVANIVNGRYHSEVIYAETTTIYTSSEFQYWNRLRTDGRDSIVFKLKACSDGHVALFKYLTEYEDEDQHRTEVVIGGFHNDESFIRRWTDNKAWLQTPQILHCAEYRTFWISWRYKFIEFGYGPAVGQSVLLTAERKGDLDHPINAIGFSTGYSFSGAWEIPENQGHWFNIHTPDNFRYEYVWKTLERRDQLYTFAVRACHDVHVALARVFGYPDYDLYIGGMENTRSCIRIANNRTDLECHDESDVLNCDSYRAFWISWRDGSISVGKGEFEGYGRLLSYTPPAIPQFDGISFSTGWGAHGDWQFDDDWENKYTFHLNADASNIHGVAENFVLTPKQQFVTFRAHAREEVVILLKDSPPDSGSNGLTYYIHMGTNNNAQIVVYREDTPLHTFTTETYLTAFRSQPYWIAWDGQGNIRFGYGHVEDQNQMFSFTASDLTEIRSVGFSKTFTIGEGAYIYLRLQQGDGTFLLTAGKKDGNRVSYRQVWQTVLMSYYKVFKVQACHSAHVLLSEKDGSSMGSPYEVIIGANNNQRTVIRDGVNGPELGSADTPGALNCNEMKTFWVSWLNRYIWVGGGHRYGYNRILSLQNPKPHPVNSISIATDGITGEWEFENDQGGWIMQKTKSTGTWYKWMMLKPDVKWIYFSARGGSPQVCFGPEYRNPSKGYRLVFGHVITLFRDDDQQFQTTDSTLVDADEMRDYWLSWEDGRLQFGKGRFRGRQVVVNWHDDRAYDVKAFGTSMGDDMNPEVEWKLYTQDAYEVSFDTPSGYDAHQFFLDVSHITHIVFGVLTCHSAHLLLSSIPHSHEPEHSYTVVIQTQSGHSRIMKGSQGEEMTSATTEGLTSCTEERYFWLSWFEGHISVGRGRELGLDIIVELRDFSYFPVNALSISTYNATGVWRFPLEDEDFQYIQMIESSSGLSDGEIAGIVIGSILLVAAFAAAVYFIMVRPPSFMRKVLEPEPSAPPPTGGFDNPVQSVAVDNVMKDMSVQESAS